MWGGSLKFTGELRIPRCLLKLLYGVSTGTPQGTHSTSLQDHGFMTSEAPEFKKGPLYRAIDNRVLARKIPKNPFFGTLNNRCRIILGTPKRDPQPTKPESRLSDEGRMVFASNPARVL